MTHDEISEHIRTLRQDYLKETQAQFAKRLGVSPGSIARYETGHVPKRTVLKVLSHMAYDSGFRVGARAFSRAVKPLHKVHDPEDLGESLLDTVTRIYGNWSALHPSLNETDEFVESLAGSIDSDLRELIMKLRKVAIQSENNDEEKGGN